MVPDLFGTKLYIIWINVFLSIDDNYDIRIKWLVSIFNCNTSYGVMMFSQFLIALLY